MSKKVLFLSKKVHFSFKKSGFVISYPYFHYNYPSFLPKSFIFANANKKQIGYVNIKFSLLSTISYIGLDFFGKQKKLVI